MSKFGYIQVCGYHGHPMANSNGVILQHRLVMAEHLGRPLTKDEIVHHKDGDRTNNDISNLELMSKPHHSREHGFEPICMVDLVCPECSKSFSIQGNKYRSRVKNNASKELTCSRSCSARHHNRLRTEVPHGSKAAYISGCRCVKCRSVVS